MRVLLDESVPRAFGRALLSHEVATVRGMGWTGVGNGELLQRAATAGFGTLVTVDRSIEHKQNVAQVGIGMVVLIAPSNRIADLWPLAAEVDQALTNLQSGQVVRVGTEHRKEPNSGTRSARGEA
jgi:hypothetical protein